MRSLIKSTSYAYLSYFLLLLLLSTNAPGASRSKRTSVCYDLIYWGKSVFTDPGMHNKDDFTYLVSAINTTREARDGGIIDPVANAENLEKKFYDFRNKNIISASVISQSKKNTFGWYGFILEAPLRSQVLATGQGDIGSPRGENLSLESIKDTYRDWPLQEPNTILAGGKVDIYNEILIAGTIQRDATVPEIKGLFYVRDLDGTNYVSPAVFERLVAISELHRIPLVPIDMPHLEDYKDEAIQLIALGSDRLALTYNSGGTRFVFKDKGSNFTAMQREGVINVSTYENRERFLQAIKQHLSQDKSFAQKLQQSWPDFYRSLFL